MKKVYLLFLLIIGIFIPYFCNAALIQFAPQQTIKASELNSNFDHVKSILSQNGHSRSFTIFQSGQVIQKLALEAEFDKIRSAGASIPLLVGSEINSADINNRFNSAIIGIVSVVSTSGLIWDSSIYYSNMANGGLSTTASRSGTYAVISATASQTNGDFEYSFNYASNPQHDSVAGVFVNGQSYGFVGYGGGSTANLHVAGAGSYGFPAFLSGQPNVFAVKRIGTVLTMHINGVTVLTLPNVPGLAIPLVSLQPGETLASSTKAD